MGLKQSTSIIIENQYRIDEAEWRSEPDLDENPFNQFGEYRLLRNIKNPDKFLCQYPISFSSKKDFIFYEDSFVWRLDQPFISKTYYFVPHINKQFCGSSYRALVYIDSPKNRLSDFKDIPYPDNLYCLSAILQGYQKIYQNMGSVFPVCEEQVGIDHEGVISVWLNRDLSKNYPQQYEIQPLYDNLFEAESQMIKEIIKMVVRNTDDSTEPQPTFSVFFDKYLQQEERSIKEREDPHIPNIRRSGTYRIHTHKTAQIVTFEEAISILDEYARKYSDEGIPPKFTSVIEIYNNEEDIYDYGDQLEDHKSSQYQLESQGIIKTNQDQSHQSLASVVNDSWQHSSQKIEFINVNPNSLYEQALKNRESQKQEKKNMVRSSRASNVDNLKDEGNKLDLKKYGFNGEIAQDPHESSNMNFGTDRRDDNLPDPQVPMPKNYFFNGDYGYHFQNQSSSKLGSILNRESQQSLDHKKTETYDKRFKDQSSSFSYLRHSNAQTSNNYSPRHQHPSFYIPPSNPHHHPSYIQLINGTPSPVYKNQSGFSHYPISHQAHNTSYTGLQHPFNNIVPKIVVKPQAPLPSHMKKYQKQNLQVKVTRPKTEITYTSAINDPYQFRKQQSFVHKPHQSEIFVTNPPSINIHIPSNNAFQPNYYSALSYNCNVPTPPPHHNSVLANNINNFKNSLYSIHENSVDDYSHQVVSHTTSGEQQHQKQKFLWKNLMEENRREKPKYCQSQLFNQNELPHSARYHRKSQDSSIQKQTELDPQIASDLELYRDRISS